MVMHNVDMEFEVVDEEIDNFKLAQTPLSRSHVTLFLDGDRSRSQILL
jgi:hypothetical protein